MKKLMFLTICLIYTMVCKAQQIELNNAVTITQPRGMVNLQKDKIASFCKEKFNGDTPMNDNVHRAAHVFTIDNILISLDYQKGMKPVDHYLLNLKHGLDVGLRENKSYTSRIDTINNKEFLITSNLSGEVKYYLIFSINKTCTSRMVGTIQFKLLDEPKAKSILNELLNGTRFKE